MKSTLVLSCSSVQREGRQATVSLSTIFLGEVFCFEHMRTEMRVLVLWIRAIRPRYVYDPTPRLLYF